MSEKVKFGRSKVFFDPFERRPGPIKKNMHYCPGCGHGILHKLIAEAIEEYGIQGKTYLIAPVGCAVFAYYYFNVGSISVPHGRAPAVATGASRANPDSYVISYQGDGDLAAIGFNEFIQAANRGEKISVFFVNNSNYGMTGGQMAPTTLPGQITTTSPYGRNTETDGFPTKVCEIINALEAPVYIERVALTSTANILKAKKAVNKAIENLRDRKGFSFVEVLSPCPVNLRMSADQVNEFIDKKMTQFFPLGCIRDRSDVTPKGELPPPVIRDPEQIKSILLTAQNDKAGAVDAGQFPIFRKERRIKICGFGGQGVLSLGHNLANMGRLSKLNVSWMPSYGPEQRGGAASCAVIVSAGLISSPMVERDGDILIAMTQTGLDKFRHVLGEEGILIYDKSSMDCPKVGPKQKVYGLDALEIANKVGNPKCANSVILGALSVILRNNGFSEYEEKAYDAAFMDAITDNFASKPVVLKQNFEAYAAGKKALEK